MKLLCFHDYEVIGAQVDSDNVSVGESPLPHTMVLKRCHKCSKLKTVRLCGDWTHELN